MMVYLTDGEVPVIEQPDPLLATLRKHEDFLGRHTAPVISCLPRGSPIVPCGWNCPSSCSCGRRYPARAVHTTAN